MTTPPFNPQPCATGAGGAGGFDVENNVLCELTDTGELVGTALAVWTYNQETGLPEGPPVFVNPITGDPYVVTTGTLQVCPDGASMGPVQFCQTGTSTAPVEHPGRMYDITLPINPGFPVDSMIVDAVTHNAGITWEVDDPDGAAFATALDAFMTARLPSGTTVTVTNPNAGTPQVCGTAAPMTIHIECVRLDQSPPNLIELVYNAGQDMVQNPAYNEFPALNPPVSQGNYGFHLLARQDDPGPFPGNQPSGRVLCTNTANRGWETNDVGRTFEIWGQDVSSGQNVTPTPRGTPVQEMASDGAPSGQRSTIWQTFIAPASGNFVIRVVHGARDPGEQHRITLDNGDTGATQAGTLIDDNTNPPSVTSNGGPNPWTQFNQTIPLTGGQTYTLALSSNSPALFNRGGLFTDMRAYIDRPAQRVTATNNDDTCTVTVTETSTTTTCSFWQPQSAGGDIVGWQRLDNGLTLSNALFWAQTPTPSCCALTASSGGDGGGTTNANLVVSDTVCVIQGGISTNAIRVVVLDPSGGQLSETFLGPNGAPVTPDNWTAGACTTNRTLFDLLLCDYGALDAQGQPTTFMRKFVQSLSATLQGQVNSHRDFLADGTGTYTVVGPVRDCASSTQIDRESACWTTTAGGGTVFTGTIRHDDSLPAPGWLLFNQNQTPVPPTEPGLTFVPCGGSGGVDADLQILCDISTGDSIPFLRSYIRDSAGAIVSFTNNTLAGAPFVPGATVVMCRDLDTEIEVLCDVNAGVSTPFIRRYSFSAAGLSVGVANTALDGSAYTPTGTVGACSSATVADSEQQILCDVNAGVPTTFIRTFVRNAAGAVTATVNNTLAGAVYTPTGTVGVCATSVTNDTDFVEEVLCDANGTSFLRLFRFNSATGVLISTTNTTLAGAAFTPVGAVGVCSNCCPAVVGQGCTNVGSGTYTAIRLANGTISLIDSVSGAAVVAGNIVPCPGVNTVVTLSSEARLIADADTAWTPGTDVTGTLTSVTMTVLSGTADLIDASGTALTGLPAGLTITWEAEDHDVLTGPQSIDAIGGQTVVSWTRR